MTSEKNGSNSQTNDAEQEGLSKQQRGRLKKLKKRALALRTDTDLSGIFKRDEWNELQELRALSQTEQKEEFCPWIGNRNTKRSRQLTQSRVVEAIDHRLILKRLHYQMSSADSTPLHAISKKRKRKDNSNNDDNAIAIPTWVTMHNAVGVDHVAVLEIIVGSNINNSESTAKVSMEDVEKVITKSTNTNDNAIQPIATSWFQGPRPQSMSDALLYEKPTSSSSKSNKGQNIDNSEKVNNDDAGTAMMKTLQSMTLSPDQWEQEGYPMIQETKDTDTQQSEPAVLDKDNGNMELEGKGSDQESFRAPSSFSIEEAQAITQQARVFVEDKIFPCVTDWKTASEDDSSLTPRVFGLDCEMVRTEMGVELARITLIQYTATEGDFTYKVLMDDLVLPSHKVVDYVTEFSGMTAKILENVTTRLEQVQASLLRFIRKQDILVGHSLENDLIACRWIHQNVIDTAVLFRSNGARKHSLKHLSNVLLQKKIQDGSHHCSEEDAAAALELAIRRAQEGDSFAIYSREKQWWIQSGKKDDCGACVFVGPSQWLQNHVTKHPNAIHALTCDSLDSPNLKAIVSWLTGPKRRAALVWAQLVVETPDHILILQNLLTELKSKMSASTVLMVSTQCDTESAYALSKNKRIAQNPRTTMGWSGDQEKELQDALEKCRQGNVFWVTHHCSPSSS